MGILLLLCAVVAYTWLGYPCLVWLASRVRKFEIRRAPCEPAVSIIVAVHDEESRIAGKLRECLAFDYPPERVEVLVASDGSTDATAAIVREWSAREPRIRLVESEGRVGKSGAQNLAARQARGDLLLFTDADTRIEPGALRMLGEDFSDTRVGLVSPIVSFGEGSGAVAAGQGLYWRYELFLRRSESAAGILAVASGAALAVRRRLFRSLPPEFGDDCVIPLDVRLQGYRVIQEPRVIVSDEMPRTIEGELRARARMTMRNWTGTLSRAALLNPWLYPATAWSLVSHKLLRWLTPVFLALILALTTLLAFRGRLLVFWALQAAFYASACLGWRRARAGRPAGPAGFAFGFCLANLGFLLGLVRAARGVRVTSYTSRPGAETTARG